MRYARLHSNSAAFCIVAYASHAYEFGGLRRRARSLVPIAAAALALGREIASDEQGRAFIGMNKRPNPDGLRSTSPGPLGEEWRRVRTARLLKAAARARGEYIDPPVFGDPAWDMMLELYLRDASGDSSTVDQLLASQDIPKSAASRWLNCLDQQGVVRCHPSLPTGAQLLELTDRGRKAMERYLDALRGL